MTRTLGNACLMLLFSGFLLGLSASHTIAQQGAQILRNDSECRALRNLVISADGAWVAAEERPDTHDGAVRVWSTKGDVSFSIERGRSPRISRDSRWVSAWQKPPLEDSRTAKPNNAGQTLVLLDTRDGSRRSFDFVLSYEVTYFSSHLAYLQSSEAKADEEGLSKGSATKPAANSAARMRKGGTLHVVELVGDRVFRWQNVTRFAAHQAINHGPREKWKVGYAYVAFVMHSEETNRDSLQVAFVGRAKTGWGTGGTYEGEKIEGLCWARDSVTLGFLDSTKTRDKAGKLRVGNGLYTWHDVRGRSGHREFIRVDTLD